MDYSKEYEGCGSSDIETSIIGKFSIKDKTEIDGILIMLKNAGIDAHMADHSVRKLISIGTKHKVRDKI